MNKLCILLITLFHSVSYSQDIQIDIHNFNYKYLEHLVKTRVDEIRLKHNCKPLINDSVLYVASKHHANYLVKLKQLSHTEDDSVFTKTPQDRVNYYGATNYRVGENILFTPYNKSVKTKDGQIFDTHTYQGLANAMVNAWLNSPAHFKNIITSNYQLTGLSVSIDTVLGRAYACQKFAIADYQYYFTENKSMFPYSNYTPPKVATSFNGINRNLLANYTYDYGLKHDKPEACIACDSIVKQYPFLTLRVERNMFILRVEDSDYVKSLINKKKDGFAVEIVSLDDYMCGNPAYYTKPSRRNGQLKINGKLTRPLYRDELYKGFKKRKTNKDVRYLSYIFNADSVDFFKRFGRYKIDRYNYEYFEISLGKVPKDITGYWAHNLVYIQDGQICHIDYLTSYCGEIIEDYQPAKFIPASSEDKCYFEPEEKFLHFTIPFEKGKSDFTKEDIQPFLESLTGLTYQLDSVHIHAYSSIEGDSLLNAKLQIQRAKNLVEVFKQNQEQEVKLSITTSTDWEGFYSSISTNAKWKYLSKLTHEEVLAELTKIGFGEIESILKTERRGEIDLYCTIHATDENLEYFVKKELKKIQDAIAANIKTKHSYTHLVESFEELYDCIHSKVAQGKLKPELLASIDMPPNYRDFHPLTQKYVMYGYEFENEFQQNELWVKNHQADAIYIHTNCGEPKHIIPQFVFIMVRNISESFQESENVDFDKVQNLINTLEKMEKYYIMDSIAQVNIDRLNINLNMILLNSAFKNEPVAYSGNAIKSIAQIYAFYEKYNLINADLALKLGKTAVYFEQINYALEIMEPYSYNDSVMSYIMPLGFHHVSDTVTSEWYDKLIQLSGTMNEKIWCNMFLTQCKIPFQTLDHEGLRDAFCETCMDKNDVILYLLGKKDSLN